MTTAVRTGLAAFATAAVLLTAACGADATDDATEPTTEPTTEATATETAAPTEIPDTTFLILETAQSNLELVGLAVEVAGEDGASVDTTDATQWVVADQDPAGGAPFEEGTTVTLTVRER